MSNPLSAAIRCVLVQLDGTPACAARLALARRVASQAGATLYAMFVAAPLDQPVQLAISESPAALLQPVDWVAASRARALFDEAAESADVKMQWLDSTGTDAEHAFRHAAAYVDLLVLGQHDASALPGTASPAGFVETTLLSTGRAALVVPKIGVFDSIGEVIVAGWKPSPSAVRAFGAAMPWLCAARDVHVIEATSGRSHETFQELGIAQHLQQHGVRAQVHHVRGSDVDAGNDLLSMAREMKASLVVMGCHGHGRLRELMLGGATRTVLERMTLPVLMAH